MNVLSSLCLVFPDVMIDVSSGIYGLSSDSAFSLKPGQFRSPAELLTQPRLCIPSRKGLCSSLRVLCYRGLCSVCYSEKVFHKMSEECNSSQKARDSLCLVEDSLQRNGHLDFKAEFLS